MKQLERAKVEEFKAHFRGDVLIPGDVDSIFTPDGATPRTTRSALPGRGTSTVQRNRLPKVSM